MKIEESLNVTFDETPPPSKTSPLVDDDLDEEEAIKEIEKKNLENDIEDETLEIDEVVNVTESRNHPLENVIGNLNQITLRSQTENQSNFFCFISTIEPKNVNEALKDESTKWVYRNKLDENGVVSRNKARCRSSNPSSSSNVLDHPSSSHHMYENDDGDDEESFHSNTPSPSQLINSLSNIVLRVFENPPHENQTIHSYQTKILNHQSQYRDEHRKGLRSIGRALKNAMKGSKN
ncbi:hypothetical protein Tco_1237299 [Tanacetum coccineum]